MLGDDKRLKKLIILVLYSSYYEEDSFVGHASRCVFDLLLTHDQQPSGDPRNGVKGSESIWSQNEHSLQQYYHHCELGLWRL